MGEKVRTGQRSAGDGMVEGLRLRLGRRRGSQGCLCLCGRGSVGEKVDFLGDGAAKVVE